MKTPERISAPGFFLSAILPSSRASEARPGTHNHSNMFCEGYRPSELHWRAPVVMGSCFRRNDGGLSPQRTLRVHIERVDRLARRPEQAVALQSTQADIGAAFGQRDTAERLAVGRKDHDAVEFGIAHAPAAPEITIDVATHAVGRAGAGVDQDALVGVLVAGGRNVVGEDFAVRYAAGLHEVED